MEIAAGVHHSSPTIPLVSGWVFYRGGRKAENQLALARTGCSPFMPPENFFFAVWGLSLCIAFWSKRMCLSSAYASMPVSADPAPCLQMSRMFGPLLCVVLQRSSWQPRTKGYDGSNAASAKQHFYLGLFSCLWEGKQRQDWCSFLDRGCAAHLLRTCELLTGGGGSCTGAAYCASGVSPTCVRGWQVAAVLCSAASSSSQWTL